MVVMEGRGGGGGVGISAKSISPAPSLGGWEEMVGELIDGVGGLGFGALPPDPKTEPKKSFIVVRPGRYQGG